MTTTHTSSDPETSSSIEISTDVTVLQAFGFDDMENQYTSFGEALLSGSKHVVLRNPSLSSMEYMELSALSAKADTYGNSG